MSFDPARPSYPPAAPPHHHGPPTNTHSPTPHPLQPAGPFGPPPPLPPRRSKKHIWFGLGGIGIGVVIGAGAVIGIASISVHSAEAAQTELIAEAFRACSLDTASGTILSADEMSVTFQGVGTYSGADFTDVYCFGEELGMPDAVTSRMGQTRALDGTQNADWDAFTVSWNYHPDDGMSAVFEFVPESSG